MKNFYLTKSIRIALPILFCMASIIDSAKAQNALAFDGIDDKVVIPAASSLIANSAGFSLTMWVYPTNPAPVFPNFDAFAGFRNDVDADFYLVQVSATGVECRLRNSAGTPFDITDNHLILNTWQHYVCTYDGANLKVYYNGTLAQTVPASGLITNSAVDLMIGDQIYSITHFLLTGKMDEVSLWDRALTDQEVSCIYISGPDTNDVDLKLYYKFNQGVAGGNNAGITTLQDQTGTLNGNLTGFALNGTNSNWVNGTTNALSVSASICAGDSYVFGGQTLTTSGTYYNSFVSVGGCDSTVVLTLTVNTIDTSVVKSGIVLHANLSGAGYTWVDCNNNYAAMPGGILQNYAPNVPGSYACIISKNGCTDTSSCYTVLNTSIAENSFTTKLSCYPNPVNDFVFVEFEVSQQDLIVKLFDVNGKQIIVQNFDNTKKLKLDISSLFSGVYLMEISSKEGKAIMRLMKD